MNTSNSTMVPTGTSARPAGRYRWFVVFLLFSATAINYLDRQLIGLLKPILETEFAWTETDFSRIVIAFTAAYALGLLVFGWFIDRVGTRIGYAVTVALWSIAGMGHALARSVVGFGLARVGLGLAEAGNYPAAVKTVAEWFPKKERALATGLFNAGTSLGVVAALLIVPGIVSRYGWQEAFWITGALGFVWLAAWLIFYDIPARQKRLGSTELAYITTDRDLAESVSTVQWSHLFRYPQTWALIVGKGLIDPIYWFFLFWLPSYFSSTFNLDLKKPSLELMLIYLATTVGSIGGGYLSSYLIRRGWGVLKARKTVLLGIAILEISVLGIQFVTDVWAAVGLISVAVALHQAWATNIFTMAADLFPRQTVSSVVGIAGMAGSVGGIFFPLLVGTLLDNYKVAGNLTGGYNVLFTICGCTYLTAWLLIHGLTRRNRLIVF